MDLNQKSVLKLLFLQSTGLHICWNLDVTFTLCLARSHRGSAPQLSVLKNFVSNIIKRKILIPPNKQTILHPKPLKLTIGLLYASLHFQTCGILTVLSLHRLVISVHI